MITDPKHPNSIHLMSRIIDRMTAALATCSAKTGVPVNVHRAGNDAVDFSYNGYVKVKVSMHIKWIVVVDSEFPQVLAHVVVEKHDDGSISTSDPQTIIMLDTMAADIQLAANRFFIALVTKMLVA